MFVAVKVSDDEHLVFNLFLDGHHLVHIQEVGTEIDVVALTNLTFLVEQTAIDDDVHKQCEAILTKSAVIGIPQSTPVGLDAIALQMVSVGIHPEGHRGDAVIVEELVVGKGELLPGDGIVGVG